MFLFARFVSQLFGLIGTWVLDFFSRLFKASLDYEDPPPEDLSCAAERGSLMMVKRLLPVSDPMEADAMALTFAAANGHVEIVKLLIPVSDPKAQDSMALACAAAKGNLAVVKVLIPVSDPLAAGSKALVQAAANGRLDVVRELIPVSNPVDGGSDALVQAAAGGHIEVVHLLLPVSIPTANNSLAFLRAVEKDRMNVAEALLPYSDIKDVLDIERTLIEARNWKVADRLSALLPLSFLKWQLKSVLAEMPAARARLTEDELKKAMPSAPVGAQSRQRL